ncbi:hypothetical protein JTE90_009680 [Oedothorax gibbosus]|uniref:Uncharacterized protein n=1 Tax=Oedothorax gibbosus TaxID=931172 RepID=A0AAV6VA85_9ARAC|nr:hypothetical protein JTE90_009680 [Oedothorax gibbosus]
MRIRPPITFLIPSCCLTEKEGFPESQEVRRDLRGVKSLCPFLFRPHILNVHLHDRTCPDTSISSPVSAILILHRLQINE